jgi:integrase
MSIHRRPDGAWDVRWREGGRNRSTRVRGSHELARKILRKKMSARDENRHLDMRREVNFRMLALIKRYEEQYAKRKKSYDREKSILHGIRGELGHLFVREVDGPAVQRWYRGLTEVKKLSAGTAVRHFNVMHHMMKKASTLWSKETGLDRNPADQIEVYRPDDQRERYLSGEEIAALKASLDQKMYRADSREINRTFFRLRMIVLIALTTGMRLGEISDLVWSDLRYSERLIAVRSKLKGGKIRYVPMTPELAEELRRYPVEIGEGKLFPSRRGSVGERQRVEHSFATILKLAGISGFRFHDLRHTFASWYMMNGGDLYELAKILGHSNIRMTERYAKLGKTHIARTGDTARGMWKLMAGEKGEQANVAV